MKLKRPNYATISNGRLVALFCKICGTTIGDLYKGRFRHRPNYAEVQVTFTDGSHHIVNGCLSCMDNIKSAELQLLYQADVDFHPASFTERDRSRQAVSSDGAMRLSEIRRHLI